MPHRPVVGLALSGGGAKGLAHIGVIKVLEEAGIKVDVVAGTSMGAIVGGLYAINYSADQLEKIATEMDWFDALNDTEKRRELTMEQKMFDEIFMLSFPVEDYHLNLPEGAIQGQKISTILSRLSWPVQNMTDFTEFPRPFCCIATDLETGEAVVIDHGDFAEAVRASMSIPTVFAPSELEGRLLIDGYVARNLPTENARDLGADIVISVDVGAQLLKAENIDNIVNVVNQAIAFQGSEENNLQRQEADILIEPDMSELTIMDFGQVEEIIRRGEEAARAHFDQLVALADSINSLGDARKLYYPISSDSIYISELIVSGLKNVTRSVILGALTRRLPGWFTQSQLELSISRMYGSGYFDLVRYRLIPTPEGTTLRINVKERTPARLRFGFHYDSDQEAALRFRLERFNIWLPGSIFGFDVTLGALERYSANYFVAGGKKAKIGVRLQLEASKQDFVYTSPQGLAVPVDVRRNHADFFLGTLFSTRLVLGGGINYADYNYEQGNLSPIKEYGSAVYGLLWWDSIDQLYFGHRGLFLQVYMHRYSENPFETSEGLYAREITFQGYLPLGPPLTLTYKGLLGAVDPFKNVTFPHYVLGGYDWIYGYSALEVSGDYVQVVRGGVQWEYLPKQYLLLEADAGRVMSQWRWTTGGESFVGGVGLTVGMFSRFGPVSLTYYGGEHNRGSVYLRVGYTLR